MSRRFSMRLWHVSNDQFATSQWTQAVYVRLEFLIHLLQSAPIRVALLYQIFSRVNKFVAFRVSNVALLCELSKKYFGDGGGENNGFRTLLFCDLIDILRIPCQMKDTVINQGLDTCPTLSESRWSILFRAMTVGNFSSTNALTTLSIVSSDQVSRGSLRANRSKH